MRNQSIPGLPSSRGRPGVEANSYSTRNRAIDDRESRTSTSRVDTERVIRVHTCSIIDRSIAYREYESSSYIILLCYTITLSVTEITQLAILFTPGSERRLKKSSYSAKFKNQLLLNNFSSAHPIVLSIEDRADFHCWLKPPNKCTQTTLIC